MIYLFNDVKELTGTVRNNHILNLLYEREKNGIYSVSAEIPVTYNDQGTIYNYNKKIQKSDFLGHYDKEGRFQLHKIAAVDIENGSIFVKGIHIFFDEAKAGAIIKDRRFISREIIDGARVAFESIGWSVADFDVSVGKTYNFYNVTPLEARQILVETFGFEFDYWLDFDGKKVTNRHVAVKEKIGEKTTKRYTYGHNVLNIRAEQDYSEIYTAVIGRGKGEEIEETGGYGRRIEYTDVVWTTPSKPLNKPAGTRVLEDPNATQLFGYKENGVVKPRVKVEVFSDIESPTELIQASYEWLMDNNVPKAVFSLKVADGDGLNLGDEVYVIYRDIDLVKSARVEKVTDDLVSGNRDVEFGDTAYFDTDRRLSGLRSDLKRYSGETGDRIYRLKMEFNRKFDEEVSSWVEEFEQNLIDQQAEIEADRENMTNLIEGTRTEFTDNLNAEITQTKEYAEQQAQAKAESVRTDLETVTNGHQTMLQELETNVMNIDNFIGPRDRTLQYILDNQREELEQKIEIYNKDYPNLVVGSTLENIDGFEPYQTTEFELRTEESLNYIRTYDVEGRSNLAYYFPDTVYLEQGNTYTIGVDFRSDSVEDLDYIYFMGPHSNVPLDTPLLRGFTADGNWHRYYITFTWVDTTRQARLMVGTNFGRGDMTRGWFDTRQVHVYKGDVHNIPWSPSPSDNAQVVSQLLYEMRQLEDGMSTLATKTEVDLLTGNVSQLTNEYQSTSEQVSSKLQNLDDVLGVNGSHFTQIAEQVQSKVWLNDVTDINPNLIPFADVRNLSDMSEYWSRFGANPTGSHAITLDSDGFYVFRDTVAESNLALESATFEEIREGEQYTLSFLAKTHSNINDNYNYTYIVNPSGSNHFLGMWTNRKHIKDNIYLYEWTFEAQWTGEARVLIGSTTTVGTDVRIRFKEPKLERGITRTPFLNAFSNIEQLANKIALQVQDLDGEYLSESDLQITPNYWQLGATRIGADNVSSVLRGSPEALDAVVSNFNLTGNLNAKGQITSLAVDAIEGNFARLFANQLTANVITADHLAVGTAMIDKFFATSARIDRLITKTHFVNEMHALTLNVVDLNASHIRSRLITTNTIEAEWLKGGTALLDKVFSSTAMFERMMAKSGFVTTLNTVTIDTDQLTIRRPDGVAWVSQGLARGHVPVQIFDNYADTSVQFSGLNFVTSSSFWKNFKYFYTPHEGSRLRVVWAVSLQTGNSASEYIEVGVNGFGNYNPISNGAGSSTRRQLVYAGQTEYITQDIPLPPPNFQTFQANLQFRRSPTGVHLDNRVTARILHIGQYD